MGCGNSSEVKKVQIRKQSVLDNMRSEDFIKRYQGGISSDYIEGSTLGSGAFAEVKICIHRPTNQQRALKILFKSGLQYEHKDKEYLLKEIRVLTKLDHPNILRIFEISEDYRRYYIIMELCLGGELYDRIIRMGSFNESQASHVMSQLLSTVSYCHSQGVTHRDLKPENILLSTRDGSLDIKVADFGSSALLDKKRKLSGCFGSSYYIAPEVLRNSYNEKCDEWSCGIIMFILLTGKSPYQSKDENGILMEILQNPLKPEGNKVKGLSQGAIELMQLLLDPEPDRRISAADALKHPWIRDQRVQADLPSLESALQGLQVINTTHKLKGAIHTLIATQILSNEEMAELESIFKALDTNGDGKISKDELVENLSMLKHLNLVEAGQQAEDILRKVDEDNSGYIDYTEFLRGCMNNTKYSTTANLEATFRLFDKDGSGDISVHELRSILDGSGLENDQFWAKVISEVDKNGDGMIDIYEFRDLMTNLKLNS